MIDAPLGPVPALATARLRLREWRLEDAPALHELYSDVETMRYWSSEPHATLAETVDLITRTRESVRVGQAVDWVIAEREGDRAIGKVAYWRWLREHRRAEIGYALRRDHWGRGLATEALQAFLRFGFERLQLHSVEAQVDPENAASIRVLRRLGFVLEGHLRQSYFHRGRFTDTQIWSLLSPDAPEAP